MASLVQDYCEQHPRDDAESWYSERTARWESCEWFRYRPRVKTTRAVIRLLTWQQHPAEERERVEPQSREMEWLTANRRRLREYQGEWLLVHDGVLVAHNRAFHVVRTAIAEHNIRSPFVYYVPNEEETNFFGV